MAISQHSFPCSYFLLFLSLCTVELPDSFSWSTHPFPASEAGPRKCFPGPPSLAAWAVPCSDCWRRRSIAQATGPAWRPAPHSSAGLAAALLTLRIFSLFTAAEPPLGRLLLLRRPFPPSPAVLRAPGLHRALWHVPLGNLLLSL